MRTAVLMRALGVVAVAVCAGGFVRDCRGDEQELETFYRQMISQIEELISSGEALQQVLTPIRDAGSAQKAIGDFHIAGDRFLASWSAFIPMAEKAQEIARKPPSISADTQQRLMKLVQQFSTVSQKWQRTSDQLGAEVVRIGE